MDRAIHTTKNARALGPAGHLTVEHGQKAVCGGCNVNRDIKRLVGDAGFAFDQVDQYYVTGQPKLSAFLTRGVARRANA